MAAMSEINLTPMIDVLLVLLILFMIAVPLSQRRIDVSVPQPAPGTSPPVPPPAPPLLEVHPDTYRLGSQDLDSADDLERALVSLFSGRREHTLLVRSVGPVSYGRVVAAMDIARGVGVDRMGMLESKPSPP